MALARPLTKAQQAATRSSLSAQPVGQKSPTITLGEAVERWTTHLHASDRIGSPRTIQAYLYGLGKLTTRVDKDTPLADITPEHIEGMLADLKRAGITDGGRALVYRPIRTFFRWAVERELVFTSPVEKVAAPKVKVQPLVFVTDDEFDRILKTTVTRSRWAFRARRDRAILLMLATTGARLSEVAELKLSDVAVTSQQFTVHGKGGKDRVLPLLDDAAEALSAYLTHERPRSVYSSTQALWLAPRGPITPNGIAQLVAERGYAAGVKRRVHAHELRHRFVAKALSGGMPGPLVMALSGHSTPSMLNRYGAHTRSEDAMNMLRAMAGRTS
jgi:site-specific recombinase XerD